MASKKTAIRFSMPEHEIRTALQCFDKPNARRDKYAFANQMGSIDKAIEVMNELEGNKLIETYFGANGSYGLTSRGIEFMGLKFKEVVDADITKVKGFNPRYKVVKVTTTGAPVKERKYVKRATVQV